MASDVTITYTNPAGMQTSYAATSISPTSGTATTFTVTFTPTADPTYGFVGTYSYTIKPAGLSASTPQTDIPYINTAGAIVNTGQLMDQRRGADVDRGHREREHVRRHGFAGIECPAADRPRAACHLNDGDDRHGDFVGARRHRHVTNPSAADAW